MIKIAVDLKGADRPQEQLAAGVLDAVRDNADLFVYAFGDRAVLEDVLGGNDRIELIDSPETMTNDEDPAEAFRTKKESSIVKAMQLGKEDSGIQAFVSCGPTGAIFVSAMMLLGRIARISPILLVELEKQDGTPFCVADCGANVDCRPEKLVDFAKMGMAYMKAVGVESPRIGLLSNGAEDRKGSAVVKRANELLRESGLPFDGNVEGSGLFTCASDVIVCDGFSGNVLLKTIEGSAKTVISQMRELGADRELCDRLYARYDFNTRGGAVLLGTKLPIVKGHGAATALTVRNIIGSACRLASGGINEKIRAAFETQ
ncbi:MAG: phosphate acyltransferase [Ruminococcus sp.]|nr:phosphate acyltransferase [Ruminococcus sp.]